MDLNLINQRLRDQFGINVSSDQSNYRIIWSDEETEYRRGLFQDFTPSGILIRSVHETRLVKKYSYLVEPQYVLERLMPNESLEIGAKLSYEPVWCFGRQRNLVWRAVELLIHFIQNPGKPFTDAQLATMEKEQIAEDEKIMDNLLQENMRFDTFHSSVQDGDTVILGNTDMWERKDGN